MLAIKKNLNFVYRWAFVGLIGLFTFSCDEDPLEVNMLDMQASQANLQTQAGDSVEVEDETLTVSTAYLFAPREGGCGHLTFSLSSNTEWTILERAPWLSLSRTHGYDDATIQVFVAANFSKEKRTAEIRITTGIRNATVTVEQEGERSILD